MVKWNERIEEMYSEMVQWRRYLHQYPELSFHEENTSKWVYDKLCSWGIEARRSKTGYSVIATIYGALNGPTVALRADLDALPIQDEKEVSYASKVDGVMHACGHDAHTSTLLGLAYVFQQHREHLAGNIRLIFQHAEEICPGGALTVIEEGGLEGVDVIYGVHLWSLIPFGQMTSKPGPFMASADEFEIDILGKGGHGGFPHETVDSIVVASHLVVQLQTIVSRMINPGEPSVVSIGSIQGGSSYNVIADRCSIRGTARTFNEQTRQSIHDAIKRMTEQLVRSFGAEADVRYRFGYPPVVNDPVETERFYRVGKNLVGEQNMIAPPLIMAAEDFAYYLQKVPGCFVFVGAGNESVGAIHPHHHSRFDIDERAMIKAAQLLCTLAMDYMQRKPLL